MSSAEYFLQLLELQCVDWLRLPLLQGIATSAIVGAEGVIRAARSAMVQYINAQAAETCQGTLMGILKDLSTILSDNLADDRYAIPVIEFLAFLIDGYIPTIPKGTESTYVHSIPKTQTVTNIFRSASEKYSPSCKRRISSPPALPDLKLQ